MKILIVDDNKENLFLLETMIKGSGYEVVSAKDGKDALEKLQTEEVSMIISDILMPIMDGFQLCKAIKKDDIFKKIPFVFYTATYTDEKDKKLALCLGADRFLVKPMEPDRFMAAMTYYSQMVRPSEPTPASNPLTVSGTKSGGKSLASHCP